MNYKKKLRYTTSNIELLFETRVSPGFSTEIIYIYLATGLTIGETNLDDDEFVEVEKIPLTDIVDKIMNGEIEDAKTIAGILGSARKLGKLGL